MLFEKTYIDLMRHALNQSDTLSKHRIAIGKFEALCTELRQDNASFTEVVDVDETEINYHIYPTGHGDYLAIIEALSFNMDAQRVSSENNMCDIVYPAASAPAFWLHIPMIQEAGLSVASAVGEPA